MTRILIENNYGVDVDAFVNELKKQYPVINFVTNCRESNTVDYAIYIHREPVFFLGDNSLKQDKKTLMLENSIRLEEKYNFSYGVPFFKVNGQDDSNLIMHSLSCIVREICLKASVN